MSIIYSIEFDSYKKYVCRYKIDEYGMLWPDTAITFDTLKEVISKYQKTYTINDRVFLFYYFILKKKISEKSS